MVPALARKTCTERFRKSILHTIAFAFESLLREGS